MTPGEARGLVGLLMANWHKQLDEASLTVYARLLEDLDYPDAERAVYRVMKTHTFWPVPAEIRRAVVDVSIGLPTSEEAWHQADVLLDEFPGSPDTAWAPSIVPHPLVWRVIKEVGGLWDLSHSTNPAADRAHFLRLYGDLRDQHMAEAAANPQAYAEILRHERAKLEAWRSGKAAELESRQVKALPPAKQPPPPGIREAVRRLISRRTLLPSAASEA